MFTSCRYCVAPKRHPGCHDHCPEYRKEKETYEKQKAEADKQKAIQSGLDYHAIKAAQRARKAAGR